MKIDKKFIVGLLTIMILASGAVYITLEGQGVKFRVDQDKATIYLFNDVTNRWFTGAREYTKLFDGSSQMNRDLSTIEIETTTGDNDFIVKRTTGYQRGAEVIETWYFRGDVDDKELFPVYHTIEVNNAKGYFLRYLVDDIYMNAVSYKLNGETEVQVGKIKVNLHPGYRWAWSGYPTYGSDNVVAQYDIPSDHEVYNFRMFDPDPTWNVTDNVGYYEDSWLDMTVKPYHVSDWSGNWLKYDFKIDNNKGATGRLCMAYAFDNNIRAGKLWIQDDDGNWTDYSDYFTKINKNGKKWYKSDIGLQFDAYESHEYKLWVKPDINESFGKWDLVYWGTTVPNCDCIENDTCLFVSTFDPTWDYLEINGTEPYNYSNTAASPSDNAIRLNYTTSGDFFNAKPWDRYNDSVTGINTTLSSYIDFAPDEDTVGLWRFEEGAGSTAYDESKYENDGTITGATRTTDAKLGNYALSFDGSNKVEIPADVSISNLVNNYTFSAWVKPAVDPSTAGNGNNMMIMSVPIASTRKTLYSRDLSDELQFTWFESGAIKSIVASHPSNFEKDTWHHIVGVKSSSGSFLYYDGLLLASNSSQTSDTDIETNTSFIGATYTTTDTLFWNGTIDSPMVINRSLTADEIKEMYLATSKEIYNLDDTLLNYGFEEGSGSVAEDISGNDDDLTIVGASYSTDYVVGDYSLYFNGSTIAKKFSPTYVPRDNVDDYTMSAWIKPMSLGNGQVPFGYVSNKSGYEVQSYAQIQSSRIRWYMRNETGGTYYLSGNNALTSGTWTQVTMVKDGTNYSIYRDGSIDAYTTLATTGNDFSSRNYFTVGASYDNFVYSNYFTGYVDSVITINDSLTSAQVKTLYDDTEKNYREYANATVKEARASAGNPSDNNTPIYETDDTKVNLTGLVGFWSMDNSTTFVNSTHVLDQSGMGNDGLMVNGTVCNVSGFIDTGCEFDGTNEYIDIPTATFADNNQASLSVWIKTPVTTHAYRNIYSEVKANQELHLRTTPAPSSVLDCFTRDWGQDALSFDASLIYDNAWHHIVCQIDKTGATQSNLYLDGNLMANVTGTPTITGDDVAIGAKKLAGTVSEYWNGSIDQVMIFDRSLSASEVQTLFETSALDYGDWGDVDSASGRFFQTKVNMTSDDELYSDYVYNLTEWFGDSSSETTVCTSGYCDIKWQSTGTWTTNTNKWFYIYFDIYNGSESDKKSERDATAIGTITYIQQILATWAELWFEVNDAWR